MDIKTTYAGVCYIKDVSPEIEECNDVNFYFSLEGDLCKIGFDDEWDVDSDKIISQLSDKIKTGKFSLLSKAFLDKRNVEEIIGLLSIIASKMDYID